MAISFLALLIFLGLLVGGGVLLVALIANKQTRPIGLGLVGAGVLGAILLLGLVRHQHRVVQAQVQEQHARAVTMAERAAVEHKVLATGERVMVEAVPHDMASDHTAATAVHVTSAPVSKAFLGSWAALLLVLVGVATLYGFMKLLNNRQGIGMLATGALTGAVLLGAVIVLKFLGVVTPMSRAPDAPMEATAISADEAWEEITRPRIQLAESDSKQVSHSVEAVITYPRHTIRTNNASSDKLLELIEVAQKKVEKDTEITLRIGDATRKISKDTPHSEVVKQLEEMTRPKVEAVESGPKKLDILVDGKELSIRADAPPPEIAERIQVEANARQGGLSSDEEIDVVVAGTTIALDGETPAEKLVEAVSGAISVSPAQNDTPVEKPEWIDAQPKRIGSVYRQVVTSGPHTTVDDCYQKLAPKLMEAAGNYLQNQFGHQTPRRLLLIDVTPGMLMRDACVDEFVETRYSEGAGSDMKTLYVQVEFDDDFRRQAERSIRALRRGNDVGEISLLGALVLLLIGGVYGLLKLDEATKGYYTKRLFIGVPVAIIGVILLGLLFVA